MELYYLMSITDRDRAEDMAALYCDSGLNLVTTMMGRGTATPQQLALYGLSRTEKAVIGAVVGTDSMKQLFRAAQMKCSLRLVSSWGTVSGSPGISSSSLRWKHKLALGDRNGVKYLSTPPKISRCACRHRQVVSPSIGAAYSVISTTRHSSFIFPIIADICPLSNSPHLKKSPILTYGGFFQIQTGSFILQILSRSAC